MSRTTKEEEFTLLFFFLHHGFQHSKIASIALFCQALWLGLIFYGKNELGAAACFAQFQLGRRTRHYWETVTECSIRHSFLDVEYDIPID